MGIGPVGGTFILESIYSGSNPILGTLLPDKYPPPQNLWAYWRDFVDKSSKVQEFRLTPVGAPTKLGELSGAIPCGVDNGSAKRHPVSGCPRQYTPFRGLNT